MPFIYMETTHDTTVNGECGGCGQWLRAAEHVVITFEHTAENHPNVTGIEPACRECAQKNGLDNVLRTEMDSEEKQVFAYVTSVLDESPDNSYHDLPEETVDAIIVHLRLTSLYGIDGQQLAENIILAADAVIMPFE